MNLCGEGGYGARPQRYDQLGGGSATGPAGLTAMKLGVLLREYGIRSTTIRFPGLGQAKGCQRADFTDAWTRYCPQLDPADVTVGHSQEGKPSQPHLPRSARYGSTQRYG